MRFRDSRWTTGEISRQLAMARDQMLGWIDLRDSTGVLDHRHALAKLALPPARQDYLALFGHGDSGVLLQAPDQILFIIQGHRL
jgi:hypothetical protein